MESMSYLYALQRIWTSSTEEERKFSRRQPDFWASRCEYVTEKDRYEINQVTGPDEWHEPVNNNLYTNYFARWNLRYVMSLIRTMKEERSDDYEALMKKTGLKEEELEFWNTVQSKIYLPRKEGTEPAGAV